MFCSDVAFLSCHVICVMPIVPMAPVASGGRPSLLLARANFILNDCQDINDSAWLMLPSVLLWRTGQNVDNVWGATWTQVFGVTMLTTRLFASALIALSYWAGGVYCSLDTSQLDWPTSFDWCPGCNSLMLPFPVEWFFFCVVDTHCSTLNEK